MESAIAQGVSPGESRGAVEAWLDSQRIQHGYSNDLSSFVQNVNSDPRLAQRSGQLRAGDLSGVVFTCEYDGSWLWFMGGYVCSYFFFDHDGKLAVYYVFWVGNGL